MLRSQETDGTSIFSGELRHGQLSVIYFMQHMLSVASFGSSFRAVMMGNLSSIYGFICSVSNINSRQSKLF